jgi:hypothetical protein
MAAILFIATAQNNLKPFDHHREAAWTISKAARSFNFDARRSDLCALLTPVKNMSMYEGGIITSGAEQL